MRKVRPIKIASCVGASADRAHGVARARAHGRLRARRRGAARVRRVFRRRARLPRSELHPEPAGLGRATLTLMSGGKGGGMSNVLLYGATGFSGGLIAAVGKARGMTKWGNDFRMTLAARDGAKLR